MRFIRSWLLLLMLLMPPGLRVASAQTVTLRVATWAGIEELQLEQRIVDRFAAQHPEVRVEVESIPTNYKEKTLAAFASGTVADVLLLDSPIIPALLNRDLLLDLTPHLPALGVDPDAYIPGALAVYTRSGRIYALPKDFTPLVLYYNKRVFDAAGVPYPAPGWTWADYLDRAHRLTADTDGDGRTDRYGTAFVNKLYLWQPWIWMTGGDILDPTGSTAVGYFDGPRTLDAMQFLVDLRLEHGVAPQDVMVGSESGANVQGALGLFYGGRLGMLTSGRWSLIRMLDYVRAGELDLGVAPLPTPADGTHTTVIYAAGWCVPRTTAHPEWAMRLAAFLAGEEAARIRAQSPIGVPALKTVAAEQVAADSLGVEHVFVEAAAYGRQSWGTRVEPFSRIEDLTEQAVDEVLLGGRPMAAAFHEAAAAIDAMLVREAALSEEVTVLAGNPEILRFLWLGGGMTFMLILGSLVLAARPERRRMLTGYAFLAPSLLLLLVFVAVPLGFSLYLSVHQWNVISSTKPFVGWANFAELFQDADFGRAFWNTLVYTLHVPVGMALALGIAVLLNRDDLRGVNVWRAIFFLPSISSLVAIAMVWQWIYHPEFGLANFALGLLGVDPLGWLTEPQTALLSVMLVSIWLGVGYQMVIFLAGLKGIPASLYESALVDGATGWQRFWHVTLPLLRPTTFFVLVTSVISSFQVFALVFVMTEGGPLGRTDVIAHHIYRNAYDYLRMGYASAMAWLLFLVILAITWLQFRYLGRKVSYG